ncbi:hypothetical protein CBR_g4635 [Chara braunii]|uniref:Uncharacterized protein n=1 Tax=Chara braunii TaxID=69332 RepID=A0A388KIE6_CHABU|nr:hypothetical protein CBR_g4635 [Chara braunii]|eukprot:GBG69806.1 hypothetical protein CBR_g4635 [Chara braunii]
MASSAELSSNLQYEVDQWISLLEAGRCRLQGLVDALSTTANTWPEVDGGAASGLEQWVEDMTQSIMEIIWEAEEGPDPRLDTFINWGHVDILMERYYELFDEAHVLRTTLEKRAQEGLVEYDDKCPQQTVTVATTITTTTTIDMVMFTSASMTLTMITSATLIRPIELVITTLTSTQDIKINNNNCTNYNSTAHDSGMEEGILSSCGPRSDSNYNNTNNDNDTARDIDNNTNNNNNNIDAAETDVVA